MYGRQKAIPIRNSDIKSNNSQSVGIHFIVDLDEIDTDLINDNIRLIEICDEALKVGEVTILNKMIHHFEPQGLTLLYLLTESHFSLHTWPEYRKIRIDFFSCENNEDKCNSVIQHLKDGFKCPGMISYVLRR